MSTMFNTPLPLAKLWSASFKNYGKVFKAIILLMLVTNFILPFTLYGAAKISMNQIFVLGVAIIILLLLLYFVIGILLRANAALQGGTFVVDNLLGQIKSRYLPALMAGLFLLLIIAFFFNLTATIFMQSTTLNMSPYTIGGIQAIVAILDMVVIVFIAFVLPFVVIDRLGPFKSYKMSFKLAIDHWWRAFFSLLLIGLFVVAINILAATLIGQIIKILKIDTTAVATIYSVQLLLDVVAILAKVWALSFFLLLFNDLKLRQIK